MKLIEEKGHRDLDNAWGKLPQKVLRNTSNYWLRKMHREKSMDRKEQETMEMDITELREYLQDHPDEIVHVMIGGNEDEGSSNQTRIK